MFNFIRHSTHRLRLWLITAAAIVLITSILEAGHVHGIFTEANDQCVLCQHSVALDKALVSNSHFIAPLLLSVLALILFARIIPGPGFHFSLIRAPPQILHRR